MYLADFHIHSNFSDGKLSIPALVDYFGKREFGAIAITDHFCEDTSLIGKASTYLGVTLNRATFPIYCELLKTEKARAWEQYGMMLIPGVEITKNSISNHRSAHFLVLGELEGIDPNKDITETSDQVRAKGGLVIAAHPVSTQKLEKQTYHLWDRREGLRNKVDAWEVASGPYLFDEVGRSGLPVIANSDFHQERNMTSWKTVLRCERRQDAIFEAIKKQKLEFFFYREVKRRESYHPQRTYYGGVELAHQRMGNLVSV
ncbi:MAG: phosphotransferase [Proteobacteria bacterium]|nr:phosphotransferase [Pseudomonadota bacterium]NDC24074.1 phosphotransferase [Pseudomonadota bacterium]NDD04059.1 phosphotransferase [Pseudomonadota bacterium]NDG25870.1 phosphotransferase [Pseudomonadota bacterium]